ncbi:MAG: DUF2249 domain-containing protein [Polaromonas sp.]
MTATAHPATLDVRTIAPQDWLSDVFSTFGQLGAGDIMELVDDHDPKPLHARFLGDLPGKFSWDYLEKGPALWRVAITRLAPQHGSGGCCGGCGGA